MPIRSTSRPGSLLLDRKLSEREMSSITWGRQRMSVYCRSGLPSSEGVGLRGLQMALPWEEFLGHFELRKVAKGTFGRVFGTPCIREYSCLRCRMRWPDLEQNDPRCEDGSRKATGNRHHRLVLLQRCPHNGPDTGCCSGLKGVLALVGRAFEDSIIDTVGTESVFEILVGVSG